MIFKKNVSKCSDFYVPSHNTSDCSQFRFQKFRKNQIILFYKLKSAPLNGLTCYKITVYILFVLYLMYICTSVHLYICNLYILCICIYNCKFVKLLISATVHMCHDNCILYVLLLCTTTMYCTITVILDETSSSLQVSWVPPQEGEYCVHHYKG